MPDLDDLNEDIAESATKPESATVDGNSATARSIDDKIKAANHVAANQAAASGRPGFGLRFQKIRPTYE
jgi:hypothetical protein